MNITLTPRVLAILAEWRADFEYSPIPVDGVLLNVLRDLAGQPAGPHDIPLGRLSPIASLAVTNLQTDDLGGARIRAESQELLDWLRQYAAIDVLPGGFVGVAKKDGS